MSTLRTNLHHSELSGRSSEDQGLTTGRRAPVQRAAGNQAVAAAIRGFEGPSSALPHRAKVEAIFGRDLGFVHAWTGVSSATARAVGARACALGDRVAFEDANPPLGTVVHEVTHALQTQGA